MKTGKKNMKVVKLTAEMTLSQAKLFFIGGPCMLENEKMAFQTAGALKEITSGLKIPFIFKASYDKANRTSIKSFRGPGIEKGITILSKIRKDLKIPVMTDVHDKFEAKEVGKFVDVLQIPAFLCRQTDLLVAAAKTGKAVNIKKGQFLSPYEIDNVIVKMEETGNKNIMLTERGFSFGYNNLVVDLKSIAYMRKSGYPVIIDATHAVQRPGGAGTSSGGEREYVDTIARGAVAAGASGVFMEVHPNPEKALSDKETQIALSKIENILIKLSEVFDVVKK